MVAQVVSGATLSCSFGMSPGVLTVSPISRVQVEGQPAANIRDHIPLANISSFGLCRCPANPVVVAATVAAMGVPTPGGCVPSTSTPWMPGALGATTAGSPSLDATSTCLCTWGGSIRIVSPGTVRSHVA
ncbi:uncharacterized protein DUF4280 [Luteibacter rhizovicinus]|uniref:Uncharacterized protein DUF4280 n=1 Tax=Luteibacter rhizovicinus TaxID=242606 RepID=A0A4R3YX70_9GAMM|nr:DUF4280 domain-containing protein [Luteibacter rhizovicinus]TCV97301.1 uncharacterized protein DUF4280 [Luteibacter rhizovicinus]